MAGMRYKLELDIDRDGRYAGGDISGRVRGLRWSHGMGRAYDNMAQFAEMLVTVNNENDFVYGVGRYGSARYGYDVTLTTGRGLLGRARMQTGTHIADENMVSAPTGTLEGTSAYDSVGRVVNLAGGIRYTLTSAEHVHIRAQVRLSAGVVIYWGADGYVGVKTANKGQRAIVLDSSEKALYFDGALVEDFGLPNALDPDVMDGRMVDIDVYDKAGTITVKINGRRVFLYEDVARTFGGLVAGVSCADGVLESLVIVEGGRDDVMFIGKLRDTSESIVPADKKVDLTFTCQTEQLLDTYFDPPVEFEVRTDTALERIFQQAMLPYPYAGSYFIVGATAVGDKPIYDFAGAGMVAFDEGLYEIEWIGDVRENPRGVSVRGYIDDVLVAEGDARFYYDARTARYSFTNKAFDAFQKTPSIIFDNMVDAYVMRDDDVVNDAEAIYYPRERVEDIVLYSSNVPVRVAGDGERTVTARYSINEDGVIVQSDNVYVLIASDWQANSKDDGTGADRRDFVTVSVEAEANQARVTIANTHPDAVFLTFLQLRGDGLLVREDQTLRYADAESIRDYDRQVAQRALIMRYVDDEDEALTRLRYYVNQRKRPSLRYEQVSIYTARDDSGLVQLAHVGLGEGVQVVNGDHDKLYVVVGEAHEANIDIGRHDVIYTLKPIERTKIFVIGVSALGGDEGIL